MNLMDEIDDALGESVLVITYTFEINGTTHPGPNVRQRHSTLRLAAFDPFVLERYRFKLDLQTFSSETAICMAECTLRTDFIPGVGPSGDHGLSVELRPSWQASEAAFHGLQCAQTRSRALGQLF